MKYIYVLLLCATLSLAEENFISTQYTSLKNKNTPVNDFLSLYVSAEKNFSFLAGDIELRTGVTGLGILKKSGNFGLFDSVHKNRGLVHSFALDYYPTAHTLVSLGRQALNINLLHGSFDGALVASNYEGLSLKAFYFKHYSILYPSYYKNVKLDKLFGVNFNYAKDNFESEISYFKYYDHKVGNAYMAVHYDKFTLGAEYLAFLSSALADERAYKLHLGYKQNHVYLEAGYYDVYEGSLRNIYALGGTEFKAFRLHGFLDHEDAQNTYADVSYNYQNFYAKLHAGRTHFKGNLGTKHTGKEFGVTLSKNYGKMELSATYFTQKSNQVGNASKRTTWIQTQIKYRF